MKKIILLCLSILLPSSPRGEGGGEPMLSTLPRPAMLGQAEQLSLDEETDAME